jgi:hypothetical protein
MTAEYVKDALDRAQRAFEASVNPATPKAEQKDAVWSYIHHVSVALWCESFAQVLPGSAALVVEWLEGALEDDTAAQWVHEARTAVAEGRVIPLPQDGDRDE